MRTAAVLCDVPNCKAQAVCFGAGALDESDPEFRCVAHCDHARRDCRCGVSSVKILAPEPAPRAAALHRCEVPRCGAPAACFGDTDRAAAPTCLCSAHCDHRDCVRAAAVSSRGLVLLRLGTSAIYAAERVATKAINELALSAGERLRAAQAAEQAVQGLRVGIVAKVLEVADLMLRPPPPPPRASKLN